MRDFPLAPAIERGACPDCSTERRVVFHHIDSVCPHGSTRERAVPCQHFGCRRPTWRDDAFCDGCAAEFAARVSSSPGAGVGCVTAPTPSSVPAAGSLSALQDRGGDIS